MFILLSFLLLLLLWPFYGLAVGKVGSECQSDEECGPFEICKKADHISPPCSIGKCICANCYKLNANDDCAPIVKLNIGDRCDGVGSNYKYPLNAVCSPNNIVSCAWGWLEFGNVCVRNTSASFGAPCRWSSDCSSDMWCSDDGTCSCYYAYDKYDHVTETCVKKEYGDSCSTSNECRVYGQNWNGYTFSTGECRDGRCDCSSNGKLAVTGYIDQRSAILRTKPICVIIGSRVNTSIGERCTVDPIYHGDTQTTSVCGPESFCYQCPEDLRTSGYGSFDGKCRALLHSEPIIKCPAIGEPTMPTAAEEFTSYSTYSDEDDNAETTKNQQSVNSQDDDYVDGSLAPPVEREPRKNNFAGSGAIIVDEKLILPRETNDVENSTNDDDDDNNNSNNIRRCSTAGDCRMNERCLMSARCLKGICACVPPNHTDAHGNCVVDGYVQPLHFADLRRRHLPSSPQIDDNSDDTFLISFIQRELPHQRSISYDDYVNNENIFMTIRKNASYGMECSAPGDCRLLPGTICQELLLPEDYNNGDEEVPAVFSCTCPDRTFWYKNATCKPVEYNEPCQADFDCDTGLYTLDGYQCVDNRCSCHGQNFTTFAASIVGAVWGTSMPTDLGYLQQLAKPATYCIPKNIPVEIADLNQNCTVQILQETNMISLCAYGLSCLYCAGDTSSGICTDITPKQQQQQQTVMAKSTTKIFRINSSSKTTRLVMSSSLPDDDEENVVTPFTTTTLTTSTTGLVVTSSSSTNETTVMLVNSSSLSSSSLATITTTSSYLVTTRVPLNVRRNNNLDFNGPKPATSGGSCNKNELLFKLTTITVLFLHAIKTN